MKYLKLTLILISSVLVLAFTYKATFADKPNALEIKGYIFHNETKIENATVKLYQDNTIVQKIHTKKSGKFQFLLFNDINYTIEIEMDKFITERIKVSTKDKTEFGGKYLYEFRVDLMKASKFKGVDISNLDFPTAIIKYNQKLGEYSHDENYAKEVKAEMKKLKAEAKNAKY